MKNEDRLLTFAELASLLKISLRTLSRLKSTGKLTIPEVKLTPYSIRYRFSDVEKFIANACGG